MRAPVAVLILINAARMFAATPPIAFEENRGQAPREVAFLARVGASRILLTRDGAVIAGGNAGAVRIGLAGARLPVQWAFSL